MDRSRNAACIARRTAAQTWEKVLFVDENTGAVDIVMDPSNPRILFAATWQLVIHTWAT